MKLVFMGTSEFAVPSLQKLHEAGLQIKAVVTQPDRPRGRGKKLSYSPVKEKALDMGLPVLQPLKVRLPEAIAQVQACEPDLIVVASYGQLIPPVILDMPRYGCINVHSSLLPAYRGAAPIHRAIMNGEKETGVTIMLMDEDLDTGDILAQTRMVIGEQEDCGQLEARLAMSGADLLVETIDRWIKGELEPEKQDETRATYAAMLKAEEEQLDWSGSAQDIVNRIRAFSPRPGAYTLWEGRRLKLYAARVSAANIPAEGTPGQVLATGPDHFLVRAGDGVVSIYEAQKEGKKRMPVAELLKGSNFQPGLLLGR